MIVDLMSDKPDLVERRQKYIQRQIELDKGAVNVDVPRAAARRERGRPTATACRSCPSASTK